jgi:hypothetical protein
MTEPLGFSTFTAHPRPMTKVHCTVADCAYWGSQNICQASEILITALPVRPSDEDVNHHGRDTERFAPTPADRKDGTYCFTFKETEETGERQEGISEPA